MKLDIASAVAKSNASTGPVRVEVVSGGVIEIDEAVFLELFARAIGTTMGANLSQGLRPDGSGPMPGRKLDGRPRGEGAAVVRNLFPKLVGPGVQLIAAHRERLGHLARIMGNVPFHPPPIAKIRAGVMRALQLAAKVAGAKDGIAAAVDRRGAQRSLRRSREQLTRQLRDLGSSKTSKLARGIRKAVTPRSLRPARKRLR